MRNGLEERDVSGLEETGSPHLSGTVHDLHTHAIASGIRNRGRDEFQFLRRSF
jgi:hypothetical protein